MRVAQWAMASHGTEARAKRHYRDGEKPCLACLIAKRQAVALRRQARKERLPS